MFDCCAWDWGDCDMDGTRGVADGIVWDSLAPFVAVAATVESIGAAASAAGLYVSEVVDRLTDFSVVRDGEALRSLRDERRVR